MSVIAKILIVLNLVLAVVFLGAAATFLGQQESWRIKHENLQARYNTDTQDLTEQRDQALRGQTEQERSAQAAIAARQELEARFDQKERDFEAALERYNNLIAQYEQLSQTYKDVVAKVDQLTQEKDRLINEKDQAMTERRQAIEEMNNAVTERKRLAGQIEDLQGQLAQLETNLTAMAEELDSSKMLNRSYETKYGPWHEGINPPLIKAQVTGVREDLNIVLLSVGSEDEVRPGFSFTVYRGNEYVGKVIVDKVEKNYASGYSVKELEKAPIQVGDKATTGF